MPDNTQDTQGQKPTPADHLAADVVKFKQRAAELESKLAEFEKEREDAKLSGLRQKEEWQKIAEDREKKVKELSERIEKQSKATETYFKRSEVRAQALKNGIREAALDDLDLLSLEGVSLETTSTGAVNVLGADKYVSRLKETRPYWFLDKSAPNVNTGTPQVSSSGTVTISDVLKLQREGKQQEYEAALLSLNKKR